MIRFIFGLFIVIGEVGWGWLFAFLAIAAGLFMVLKA